MTITTATFSGWSGPPGSVKLVEGSCPSDTRQFISVDPTDDGHGRTRRDMK